MFNCALVQPRVAVQAPHRSLLCLSCILNCRHCAGAGPSTWQPHSQAQRLVSRLDLWACQGRRPALSALPQQPDQACARGEQGHPVHHNGVYVCVEHCLTACFCRRPGTCYIRCRLPLTMATHAAILQGRDLGSIIAGRPSTAHVWWCEHCRVRVSKVARAVQQEASLASRKLACLQCT